MVKVFVKILEVPPAALMPAGTMILMVGIFSLTGSYFDLILVVAFGGLGYVLRKMDIPTAPVILGILLGGTPVRCDGLVRCQCLGPHIYPPE
jgi:putative tricarboxylic transport membrane protein